MRVLGIDPGSHRTGFGLVHAEGGRLTHVDSGVLVAPAGGTATRLVAIAEALDAVLAGAGADAVAIETVFHAKNSQSALMLGQARGVAILCVARSGAQLFEYTAGQIKQAVTGRGRADKEQVQEMVRLILGLSGAMALDTSDALAAAICHAQSYATPATAFLAEAARWGRRGKRGRVRPGEPMPLPAGAGSGGRREP